MRIRRIGRWVLLIGAVLLVAVVIVGLAEPWGTRALYLSAIPLALIGWFWGVLPGLIAGVAMLTHVLWLPMVPGLHRPTLDQLLLLGVLASFGPVLGAIQALKSRHDRHLRASSEARFDSLTGLRNRAAVTEELEAMCQKLLANPLIEDYEIQIDPPTAG